MKRMLIFLIFITLAICLFSCTPNDNKNSSRPSEKTSVPVEKMPQAHSLPKEEDDPIAEEPQLKQEGIDQAVDDDTVYLHDNNPSPDSVQVHDSSTEVDSDTGSGIKDAEPFKGTAD